MADVNFYLRDKTSPKDTGVILFFSFNGKRIKIKTVEKINPKFWDSEKQRAKQVKAFPSYPEFNQRLKETENICLDVFRRYLNDNKQGVPAPEVIRKLMQVVLDPESEPESASLTLFKFIGKFIDESKNRLNTKTGHPISKDTITNYKRTALVLKEYSNIKHKRKELGFDDITLDFYIDFSAFLSNDLSLATNTVGKHIKTLKTFLSDATERGINTKTDFKSKSFKVNSVEVDNIYLNKEELKTLFNLDLSDNPRLGKVRDLFLVGCWTGLRFSDFSRIESGHIKESDKGLLIEIETQKTRQKVVIPVHKTVQEIMERYKGLTDNSLPPAISNVKMNKYLKELGEIAGLDEVVQIETSKKGKNVTLNTKKYNLITTHTARRSFATNIHKSGVSSLTIMSITGHQTEKAFLKYIKTKPSEQAEILRASWADPLPVMKVV